MSLHDKRNESGLSQSQLAKKSGVNVRTIQFYERNTGSIDGAKLNTLIELSNTLNCGIAELLDSEELKEKCNEARF